MNQSSLRKVTGYTFEELRTCVPQLLCMAWMPAPDCWVEPSDGRVVKRATELPPHPGDIRLNSEVPRQWGKVSF